MEPKFLDMRECQHSMKVIHRIKEALDITMYGPPVYAFVLMLSMSFTRCMTTHYKITLCVSVAQQIVNHDLQRMHT